MKPHEETLARSPTMPSEVVRRDTGETVGFARSGDMAELWSAAPEMARALLMCGCWSQNGELKEWHTHLCWRHHSFVPFNTPENCTEDCRATHAALAKAGVPLS
jgi:hypothetical protein